MDSLLANYSSDAEDSPPGSPNSAVVKSANPAPSWNRQSFFGPLPPPKNSALEISSLWDDEDEPVKPWRKNSPSSTRDNQDQMGPPSSLFTSVPRPHGFAPKSTLPDDEHKPLRRPKVEISDTESELRQAGSATSFFSSLPPPKVENGRWVDLPRGSAKTPKVEPVDEDGEQKKQSGPRFFDLFTPKREPTMVPGGFFDNLSSFADGPSEENDFTDRKTSSLFTKLPTPASSSRPLLGELPPPSTSKAKQVVGFRPPINYALLQTTDEDQMEQTRKRSKPSKENCRTSEPDDGGGLIALLPPPKNILGSGAALGGGVSHGGRRTVMETASDPYKREANSNPGSIFHKAEKSEVKMERLAVGVSNNGYGIDPAIQSSEVSFPQPDGGYHDPQHRNAQQVFAPYQYGTGDGYSVGNEYAEQSWQYPAVDAYGTASRQSQGSTPVQLFAEVMKKERRKGRDEPPPQMIEVKQTDLTGGSKLREDQIRTTGIAFGPNYKPAASNKDKPSKIHRRKHQIGALYFDMKQNEMNLLDRRAKGNLTKAETQAKYGW